ncbi:FecR family protein [Pedobacter sp. L105]|uniref:FecR family protein n=1 Tax=Pedobacter sp. L105 TaxID=1641871 RepID=UPI00131E0DB8|nr:FecR family protein [Pedobacter sp. L105]
MNQYESYFDLGKFVAKYLRNELTEEEKITLDHWLEESNHNRDTFNRLTDESFLNKELENFPDTDKDAAWKKISESTGYTKTNHDTSAAKNLLHYAAVLIMLLSIGFAVNQLFNKKQKSNTLVLHQKDILPGSNKAVLTLANGSKIVLNDAKRGKIASQENVDIDKTENGQVVYKVKNTVNTTNPSAAAKLMAMNTIVTPRGGQYMIILPDGTKVWLNAASSLKYPTEFQGNERRVELTGEAYFEVAKNAAKPFFVKTISQTVEVLGTHFNVSSYADETTTKTTLLEGSVKVSGTNGRQEIKLKPGQQAVGMASTLKVLSDPDIDEAMAWKNGKFLFRNASLPTIMRQLSRWYDVDVEYQGDTPERHYRGRVSRDVPVSQVFEILKTSGINFTISGRKIIVKS